MGRGCLGQSIWRDYSVKDSKDAELQISRIYTPGKEQQDQRSKAVSQMLSGGGVGTIAKSCQRTMRVITIMYVYFSTYQVLCKMLCKHCLIYPLRQSYSRY